jgi:hypothetical protein
MRWTCLFIVGTVAACGSSSEQEPNGIDTAGGATDSTGGAAGTNSQAPSNDVGSSGSGGAGAGGAGGNAHGGAGASGAGAAGARASGGAGAKADGGSGVNAAQDSGANAEVLSCDDVKPGSGWQKITPPGDLGDAYVVTLDPLHVGTVYVQMQAGIGKHFPTDGLYKSTDCGSSWNRLPPGRNATDTPNASGKVINIHKGILVSLIIDPVESGVMYTVSNYGPTGIYKSTNGGVDWDQVIPANVVDPGMDWGGWFNSLSIDPTDRKHLVGGTHTGCKGAWAPNCLAETRDGGATWRLLHAPLSDNEQCGPYIYNSTTMMYATGQNGAWVTTNDTANNDNPTWTKISQGANGADEGLLAYRASNGRYYLGSDYGVLEGSADFSTWQVHTNSPGQLLFIVGTGENLYASARLADFYTAKETSPNVWSKLEASGTPPDRAGRWLSYDAKHKLLYSSIWGDGITMGTGGLFRLPTP